MSTPKALTWCFQLCFVFCMMVSCLGTLWGFWVGFFPPPKHLIHSRLYTQSIHIKVIANLLQILFPWYWNNVIYKYFYININTCKTNQKIEVLSKEWLNCKKMITCVLCSYLWSSFYQPIQPCSLWLWSQRKTRNNPSCCQYFALHREICQYHQLSF